MASGFEYPMSSAPKTVPKSLSADDSASGTPTSPFHPNGDTVGPAEPTNDVASMLRPPETDGEIGRLGGYRLLKVLGRGGMGVVFLGEDLALGRSVAIKAMLPASAAEPTAKERFLREARAAAAIKDDHVVTIHHVGEDNGVPFLVMELLAGESLAERIRREARLKADNGWLTVVGLHWLKEGVSRVGSDSSLEVVLPSSVPKQIGTITLKGGKARFTPGAAAVFYKGKPAIAMDLKPDTASDYDILNMGAVNFYLIQRENRFGIRVKDNQSRARQKFSGLKWYPVDPTWRVRAKFVPWDKPRMVTFDTEVGVKEQDESPGYVTFTRAGKEYRLVPVNDGDDLWFVMRDGTSGKSTYAASRFLYVPKPKDGVVDLDFNRAENPPCVFTAYATCPLPPPENRLSLPVTAGEMMYAH